MATVTITVKGAEARIDGAFTRGAFTREMVDAITEVTSYYKNGYEFSNRYRNGHWDGRIRLFRRYTRTFPSGLLNDVKSALKDVGLNVRVDDVRNIPPIPPLDPSMCGLEGVSFEYPYDFQLDVMEKAIIAQRGILHMATNSGKTEVSCLIAQCLRVPTLFLVPGKELLYQTADRYMKRLGVSNHEVGMIGDSRWNEGDWITIATTASIHRNLKKEKCQKLLNKVQLLILDECHLASSNSWYEVAGNCPAFFRFGMSGTPLQRTDGADLRLMAQTGPVIVQIRNKELIDRGISSEVEVLMVRVDKPTNIHPKTPYADAYDMGITENLWRNNAICHIVNHYAEQGLQSVVLVRKIDHGRDLDKRLWTFKKKSFLTHQFISGKESTSVRQRALKEFSNGDLRCLIATSILNQGVDTPAINVLIPAGGGESSIQTLQRVGRGIRKGSVGKLIVVDFADFQNRHLLKHSLQRLRDYRNEECFDLREVKLKDFK
jgi:superfamily II DNA or RNA helicase